jgi:translation initiation factor 2 beta subunit (eIF-2beta)/eIF-5
MVDNDPIKIGLGQLQERLNMENHLKEYIEKELKKQINFNEDRQLIIAGSFNDGNIEILLSTYLNKYVRCRQCQSMMTILGKYNRQEANLCLKCYNINLISNLQNKMK